jgi:S1-C subfamily serine protease
MNFIKLLLLLPVIILIAVFLSYTSTKTLYNPSSSLDELIFISHDYLTEDTTVVNILCHTTGTDYKTATGVLIDPRGYVLSNAHVATDINRSAVCSVGRGSPAVEFGDISLVFIPASYASADTEAKKTLYDISIWKIRGSNYNLPYREINNPAPKGTGYDRSTWA